MPYIDKDRRVQMEHRIDRGDPYSAETPGELNYALAKTVDAYLSAQSRIGYTQFNEVIGVLESLKLEVYRRMVAPYEDEKIELNGDVFDE